MTLEPDLISFILMIDDDRLGWYEFFKYVEFNADSWYGKRFAKLKDMGLLVLIDPCGFYLTKEAFNHPDVNEMRVFKLLQN